MVSSGARWGWATPCVIGLGSMIGAGIFAALAPGGARGRVRAAARAGGRRRGRLLQRHVLGSAGRPVSGLRRHLRLRPRAPRAVLGLSGGLGVRGRQDGLLRGHGAHRRRVRSGRRRRTRRRRRRGGADRGELRRGAEVRPGDPGRSWPWSWPSSRAVVVARLASGAVRRRAAGRRRVGRCRRGAPGGRSAVLRLRRVRADRHPRRGGARPGAHDPARRSRSPWASRWSSTRVSRSPVLSRARARRAGARGRSAGGRGRGGRGAGAGAGRAGRAPRWRRSARCSR